MGWTQALLHPSVRLLADHPELPTEPCIRTCPSKARTTDPTRNPSEGVQRASNLV